MSGQRQKNQPEQGELAFTVESRSDAPKPAAKGTETLVAKRQSESLAGTERLMEEVCELENCKQALQRVKANKGSPGVDGMTVGSVGGESPPRSSLVLRRGFGSRHVVPVALASRRWSRRLRLTCAAGLGTSATVKHLRCCAALKRGYAADFGQWRGSNGSRDERDFANFANGM